MSEEEWGFKVGEEVWVGPRFVKILGFPDETQLVAVEDGEGLRFWVYAGMLRREP